MKGDFSRQTFRKQKHYDGVLMQQGRVQLDADFNEQAAITRYHEQTEAVDVIGASGTPRAGTGFRVSVGSANDLRVGGGHYYVDGILCENDASGSIALRDQPDLSGYDALAAMTQKNAVVGLAYLDVWQRHVTALDDPLLRETALGGPDTTTRLQTVWQVKVLPLPSVVPAAGLVTQLAGLAQQYQALLVSAAANAPAQAQEVRRQIDQILATNNLGCATPFAERGDLRPLSTGSLNARTDQAASNTTACELPPTAGYQRLENQLYRVEIHTPGATLATSTFKWSRENGSVVVPLSKPSGVNSVSGTRIEVTSLGRDTILGFKNGDWVEIVDDQTERTHSPGRLARVNQINSAASVIVLDEDPGAIDLTLNPRLRRWDQAGTKAQVGSGIPMTSGWLALEGGIQVSFSQGIYNSGDYWLIPARTATGEIEWPPYAVPNTSPQAQPPHGTRHHFCDLALILLSGGQLFVLDDCRDLFPALTDIRASDVSFDNTHCDLPNVNTVQEALDALCDERSGVCTITLVPGDDVAATLSAIGTNQDAYICFQVGEYTLNRPVELRQKGNLKLIGSGFGTRIIAPKLESAFIFDTCRQVLVRDLSIESGVAGLGKGTLREHLGGTLSVYNCREVTIETVAVRCAAGLERAAACIRVDMPQPENPLDASLTIRDCTLHVGHQQVGILVATTTHARIENNRIQVNRAKKHFGLPRLMTNKQYRAGVRKLLVHNLEQGLVDESDIVSLNIPVLDAHFAFRTNRALADAWRALFEAIYVEQSIQTMHDARSFVEHTADNLLVNRGKYVAKMPSTRPLPDTPEFAQWYQSLLEPANQPVMSQGIVVTGAKVFDVQIRGNTIDVALQGIHVASDQTVIGNLVIRENRVAIVVSPFARERHGIFVGSSDHVTIEDNELTVFRFEVTQHVPIDGIRVYGKLGRSIHITENTITDFSTGIRFQHIGVVGQNAQFMWRIANNFAPGSINVYFLSSNISGKVRELGTNLA